MIRRMKVSDHITLLIVKETVKESIIKDVCSLSLAVIMVALNVWFVGNNWVLNVFALLLFLVWAMKTNATEAIDHADAIMHIKEDFKHATQQK